MFRSLHIDRVVFLAALNCVNSVPLQRRGKPSFVNSHRDKLLFLMVFLSTGSQTLKTLCLPHVTSEPAILHNIHDAANRFLEPLVRNTVIFEHERVEQLPMVSAIVDCTVVEIKGPDTPFGEQDVFIPENTSVTVLRRKSLSTSAQELWL